MDREMLTLHTVNSKHSRHT